MVRERGDAVRRAPGVALVAGLVVGVQAGFVAGPVRGLDGAAVAAAGGLALAVAASLDADGDGDEGQEKLGDLHLEDGWI